MLLENIQSLPREAQTLVEFVHFCLSKSQKISDSKFKQVQEILAGTNSKLLYEYEMKLTRLEQLNNLLLHQLK